MIFADDLRQIMKIENLTQKEVSVICHITPSNVSKYLSGSITPSYRTACKIMKDLGYELMTVKKKKDGKKNDLKKNGSGYLDLTAYKAIKKVDADRERMMKLLDVIFTICEYAGFHVEERIVLKDKRTGKVWR